MRDPKDNRRYKLHQRLAKAGITYLPHNKTIYKPQGSRPNRWEKELINKFNYSLQFFIPE